MSVYVLTGTVEHLGRASVDAAIRNSAVARAISIRDTSRWAIVEPVRFSVSGPLAGVTDHPWCDGLRMFSRRVIDAMERAGDFAHRTYDVSLEAARGQRGEEVGTYQLLQVMERLAVLDRERTEHIRMSAFDPTSISNVRNPVLAEPTNGFPPVFWLEEVPIGLLVNEATKREIEGLEPPPLAMQFKPVLVNSAGPQTA